MFQPEGTPQIVHLLTFFLLVVAGLGMFVGVVCLFLFSGAREALEELGEMWADTIKRHKDDSILDSFPDVRGGRARKGLERGNERYIHYSAQETLELHSRLLG